MKRKRLISGLEISLFSELVEPIGIEPTTS